MAEEQSGEVAVEEISLGTHFHGKNIHNCVLVPRELVVHELALPVPSGPIQISVLFFHSAETSSDHREKSLRPAKPGGSLCQEVLIPQ
jgi:hypothetical protein